MKKIVTKKLGDMTENEIRQVRNRLYRFKKDCFNCSFRCNDVISADSCLIYDIFWKNQIKNNKDLEFEFEVEE